MRQLLRVGNVFVRTLLRPPLHVLIAITGRKSGVDKALVDDEEAAARAREAMKATSLERAAMNAEDGVIVEIGLDAESADALD